MKEFLENEKFLSGNSISSYLLNNKILNVKSLKLNKSFNYVAIANLGLNSLNFSTTEIEFDKIPDRATYVLKENDIIISTVRPNRNAVALITNSKRLVGTSGFCVIRTNNNLINPFFVFAFCKTRYFVTKLIRENTATMYPAVTDYDVLDVKIPEFSKEFQNNIELLISESLSLLNESKIYYSKAENVLKDDINLSGFQPSTNPINLKNFKESFLLSGRLDAEYYQPKYEDYSRLIESYRNGFGKLDIKCSLNLTNYNPEDDFEYKYIELSNIGSTGDITGCTIEFGKDLPTRARRKVNTGDVIISSIEGSLQSCAIVTNEYNNALCSTGFYVINSDKINSETLLVLFKSELMQNILKQNCSGTILTGINKDEFSNIPIPLIDSKVQSEIAKLIQESFGLKQKSEKLLEVAKRSVEIAIEENEQVALKYIAENS